MNNLTMFLHMLVYTIDSMTRLWDSVIDEELLFWDSIIDKKLLVREK